MQITIAAKLALAGFAAFALVGFLILSWIRTQDDLANRRQPAPVEEPRNPQQREAPEKPNEPPRSSVIRSPSTARPHRRARGSPRNGAAGWRPTRDAALVRCPTLGTKPAFGLT